MESHVGSVAITIRAPASSAADTRGLAERFAIGVLTRCDDLLEQRAPGRVILLRHLDLSLRLRDGALENEGELAACAHAAADSVEERLWAVARVSSAWPPEAEGDVAIFDSDVDWRAAHLHAWARGSSASDWRFAPLEREGEPHATIRGGGPRLLRNLLAHLHRRHVLAATLDSLSTDRLVEIADAVGAPGSSEMANPRGRIRVLPTAVVDCLNDLDRLASPHAAWIRIVAATDDALGPSGADPDVHAVARSAFAAFTAPGGPGRSAPAADMGGPNRTVLSTAFGGAFYLMRSALELGLGEALWRACLPEGAVLARAVAALLGPAAADDPVAWVIGGVSPDDQDPIVSPEQQREVAISLWQALVEALPRRGLAAMPEPVLRLVDTDAGPLLVAAATGGPFMFFAMPAASPAEIRVALDTFLTAWPASAPRPRATPALVELDRRGRMRPVPSGMPQRPAAADQARADDLVVRGGSLAASALMTQIAGSLGQLFTARAGFVKAAPRERVVDQLFAVPAGIVLEPDTLEVRIPMEHTNLVLRRAALDADPGWVPWVSRRVFFTFD